MTAERELLLKIGPDAFDDQACCTGEQLAVILRELGRLTGALVWYAADVETNDGSGGWPAERSPRPSVIGGLPAAISRAENSDQFLSGVFVGAVPSVDLADTESWTDDERSRPLRGASVEIRMFDTSYFEVHARDDSVLHDLASAVGGQVQESS